jgi:hypothetical protein
MLRPTERHSYLPSTYEQGNTLPLISATLGIWLQLLGFFFQDFVMSPKWWSSQKISLANCGCKLDMTVPRSPPPKKIIVSLFLATLPTATYKKTLAIWKKIPFEIWRM